MSNKCFKRVLEGTINDNSLPTFGKVTIRVTGANSTEMYLGGANSQRVASVDVTPGLSCVAGSGANVWTFTGTGSAFVDCTALYGIYVATDIFSVSLDDLLLCPNLSILNVCSDYMTNFFNLKQLKHIEGSLRNIVIRPSSLYGDVADLPNLLTNAEFRDNPNIGGDIANIGNCLNLTWIGSFRGTQVYGSFEDMVAKFRTNGKTTGSITFNSTWIWPIDVTFNGAKAGEIGSDKVLTWTATTITWNGVTINA